MKHISNVIAEEMKLSSAVQDKEAAEEGDKKVLEMQNKLAS